MSGLITLDILAQVHRWFSEDTTFTDGLPHLQQLAASLTRRHSTTDSVSTITDRHLLAASGHDETVPVEISLPAEKSSIQIASDVLDVLQRYGQHLRTEGSDNVWLGRSMFEGKVLKQIENNQPIRMILPSFPWKSINRVDKVTGALPDLGEELALTRMNNLCKDIEKVYPKGGEITIATDGLVFDDIVGITDDDTWEYSEALIKIAKEKGFTCIKLLRVMDVLGLSNGKITRESYKNTTATCRKALEEQYCRTEAEVRTMMETDNDTLLTYRGFIRFLETDVRYSPIAAAATSGQKYRKIVKSVAIKMMVRAESFTKLLQAKCSNYVRLSIHPSSGAVKLSFPLIQQADGHFPRSPWHCSIAVGLDGSYSTVHAKDVRDTHRLMYRDGRPYYFREKSSLWDWEGADDVEFEYLVPSGLLVRPKNGVKDLVLKESWKANLELLRKLQVPVRVEGFAISA